MEKENVLDEINEEQMKLMKRKILKYFQSKVFNTDSNENIFKWVATYRQIESKLGLELVKGEFSPTHLEVNSNIKVHFDMDGLLFINGFYLGELNTLIISVQNDIEGNSFLIELF